MKECLKCGKEFQEKKETAKFCSTSCRVMYNRKHPNPQKKVTELKLEVLYNSLLDMVGKINYLPNTQSSYDGIKVNTKNDESLPWDKPEVTRKPKSVVKYISERLQIDTVDGFEKWTEELESDPFLSDRDKKDAKIKTL